MQYIKTHNHYEDQQIRNLVNGQCFNIHNLVLLLWLFSEYIQVQKTAIGLSKKSGIID